MRFIGNSAGAYFYLDHPVYPKAPSPQALPDFLHTKYLANQIVDVFSKSNIRAAECKLGLSKVSKLHSQIGHRSQEA